MTLRGENSGERSAENGPYGSQWEPVVADRVGRILDRLHEENATGLHGGGFCRACAECRTAIFHGLDPLAGVAGEEYVTPSGRHWRAGDRLHFGKVPMFPLGFDTRGSGGGVKTVHVDPRRLTGNDKTWRYAR